MLAPTHSVFGIFLTLIILAVFGIQESLHWSILIVAVIGSVMPDIDHPKSTIGRLFFFVSVPLERKFGHRTITHSLLGWLVASAIFSVIIYLIWWIYGAIAHTVPSLSIIPFHLIIRWMAAFSIGYLSHILLDMANPRGVQLLWPNDARDVISRNPDLRPKAGSKAEILIFLLLVVLMILSFPISKHGIMTSLRWLLATPESAIEEFKNTSTKTNVQFMGVMTQTRIPVSGKAEIVDVKNKRLIVRYKGKVYTLSDEGSADIVASQVRVEKTKNPVSITRKIFTAKTRHYLLSILPNDALVSGTIQLPNGLVVQGLPASVQQVGDELRLTYATKPELSALKMNEAFQLVQAQDKAKLAKLHRNIKQTKSELANLSNRNGLTPLGEKYLVTQKERQAKQDKKEQLINRLSDLNLELAQERFNQKSHQLTFSGDVMMRR